MQQFGAPERGLKPRDYIHDSRFAFFLLVLLNKR